MSMPHRPSGAAGATTDALGAHAAPGSAMSGMTKRVRGLLQVNYLAQVHMSGILGSSNPKKALGSGLSSIARKWVIGGLGLRS